jgi:hypothetical protein
LDSATRRCRGGAAASAATRSTRSHSSAEVRNLEAT